MATLNHLEDFRGFFNDMDILVSKNIQLLGCKEKKPVYLLLVKNYLRCWQNCVLNPNNFSRRLSNWIIKRSLTLKWFAQEIPFKQSKKFSLASPFCRQSFWYQSTRMARLSSCRHTLTFRNLFCNSFVEDNYYNIEQGCHYHFKVSF